MEEDKYQNKYRVLSHRLQGWDYGAHGLYFVTICTKDQVQYFGEIVKNIEETNSCLNATEIGKIATHHWMQIPEFHPYVELDEFVIMPDHLHGILFFNNPDKTSWETNKFGGQKNNLASVLRGYKASVKKFANENNIEFSWQPKYYDRVIRDKKEYDNVREYIYNNPNNWLSDNNSIEKFI